MIKIQNLRKTYGAKIALKDLSLEIDEGEIFGLLGHNGAGKSTTIKSLVSIIEPTSGQILVDGQDLKTHRLEIKKKIGYVADTPDLFLKLTAFHFWSFIADVYDIPHDQREARLAELCEIFEMSGHYFEKIESFSHGMRQKTFIIGALLANPQIWILDEPMTGLDPQAAFNLKELMKKHAAQGHTVIFSTHVLEVAEQLCDRLAILSQGHLLFVGTMEELKRKHPGKNLEEIYLGLTHSSKANSVEES